MHKRGGVLQSAQQNAEAVAAYAAMIERFQESSDNEIRKTVALSRGEAGITSGAARKFDAAVSYLDKAIDDLKNASHPA